MDAVWLLTRLCLEWSGNGEPRLQHFIRYKRSSGRTQDLADEALDRP